VLCDLLLRHWNDVGSDMFRDAGEVVSVPQTDDAENMWDQVTGSSRRLKNPGIQTSDACNCNH